MAWPILLRDFQEGVAFCSIFLRRTFSNNSICCYNNALLNIWTLLTQRACPSLGWWRRREEQTVKTDIKKNHKWGKGPENTEYAFLVAQPNGRNKTLPTNYGAVGSSFRHPSFKSVVFYNCLSYHEEWNMRQKIKVERTLRNTFALQARSLSMFPKWKADNNHDKGMKPHPKTSGNFKWQRLGTGIATGRDIEFKMFWWNGARHETRPRP